MPRVTTVDKARQDQGKCEKCGTEIKAGMPYLWWKFRYGGKHKRCKACPPKASDLTQSEFLAAVADFQERSFSDAESLDDLESQKDELVSDLESLRDEQEEKRNNMPENLQESATGELLQERYDGIDSVLSELEQLDFSCDEDEPEEPTEPDEERKEGETDEAWAKRKAEEAMAYEEAKATYERELEEYQGKVREKIEEVADEISSALGNLPG